MLTDKLTNIANAIREKGGTTELLTLDAMPTAIAAIETGGGGGEDIIPNPLVFTGKCEYLFYSGRFKWLYPKLYEAQFIDTTDIAYCFCSSPDLETTPAISQLVSSYAYNWRYTFSGSNAKSLGDIHNFRASSVGSMFLGCKYLRETPNFINPRFNRAYSSAEMVDLFRGCYSLRKIDSGLLASIDTEATSSNYHLYKQMFYECYSLDEAVNIPTTGVNNTLTSNMMGGMFSNCCRLKKITFATESDGTPCVRKWKNQVLDLSQYVGWAGAANSDKNILNYNSGITAEDEDNDWSNNPNYWSRQFMNSRFNHDSAIELINSLPDTSAYLATQSSATNTVKFKTDAGSSTPGGGVNGLTEEEIAVAAAKGWTIGFTV